jgi:hypothetical protein
MFWCAAEEQEETGWKYIHGDVFRPPYQLNLFAACVGTGTQILTMAVAIFALALVGVFYPYNRGALLTACVVRSLNRRADDSHGASPASRNGIKKGYKTIHQAYSSPPL